MVEIHFVVHRDSSLYIILIPKAASKSFKYQ